MGRRTPNVLLLGLFQQRAKVELTKSPATVGVNFIMIQANDLRIGNYVNHKTFGICKIVALDYESICIQRTDLDIKEWFDLHEFKPTPLTEEILLKCGFENYTGDFLELTITEDISIIWVGYLGIMIGGSAIFFPDKDKVHELQNLYKELKGEELTVNL